MDGERERELLTLMARFFADTGWQVYRSEISQVLGGPKRSCVEVWKKGESRYVWAEWAESEACLREVAGECAVRAKGGLTWKPKDSFVGQVRRIHPYENGPLMVDESRPVALLRAFVAAFSETNPKPKG